MKAINFLEWCLKGEKSLDLNQTGYDYLKEKDSLIHKVANFYSQPFNPEMITELFEGWTKSKDDGFIIVYRLKGKCGYWVELPNPNDVANGDYVMYDNGQGEHDFFKPQTLDHFISDCQRAGIELTFKHEIAEKYFK